MFSFFFVLKLFLFVKWSVQYIHKHKNTHRAHVIHQNYNLPHTTPQLVGSGWFIWESSLFCCTVEGRQYLYISNWRQEMFIHVWSGGPLLPLWEHFKQTISASCLNSLSGREDKARQTAALLCKIRFSVPGLWLHCPVFVSPNTSDCPNPTVQIGRQTDSKELSLWGCAWCPEIPLCTQFYPGKTLFYW